MMKTSIIFPCYNESSILPELFTILESFPNEYNVEFILVENGSTDDSRQKFDQLKSNKRIKKVYVDKNRGYGYGIIQGLKVANGDFVGWLHADLQYNPHDLKPFLDLLPDGKKSLDGILLKGRRRGRTRLERFFTAGMGVFDSIVFKTKMKEVMSSPTIISKEALKYIEKFPYDFSIDIYVYALAKRLGYSVRHVPITLNARKKGRSSWNSGLKSRLKMSKNLAGSSLKIRKNFKKDV